MINYIDIYEELDKFLLALYETTEYKSYIEAHKLLNKNKEAKQLQLEIETLIDEIIKEKELHNFSKKYSELFKEYNKKLKIFYAIPEVITVLKTERDFQSFLDYVAKDLAELFTNNISVETFRNITLDNDKCSNCSVLKD